MDSTNLNLDDLCGENKHEPGSIERVMRHWQFTRSPLVYWTRKMVHMATMDRWFNHCYTWLLDALLRSEGHIHISPYRAVQELPMIEDSLNDKLGGQKIVNYGLPEEEVASVCKQGGNSAD